jgi:hypothetical protein
MAYRQDASTGYDEGADPGLAALAAEFPEFAIWRELTGGRIQYIARRTRRGVHPHTIVTSDPAELRTCLAAG